MTQIELFDCPLELEPGPDDVIEQEFRQWLETSHGQRIYTEFVWRSITRRWGKVPGRKPRKVRAKAVIELIRDDPNVPVGPGRFKIDNRYTSRLARVAMEDRRLHDGFETRDLKRKTTGGLTG